MFALIIPISFAFSAPQSHSSLSAYDLTNPELISQGKELFAQNCAVGYCHGSAGRSGRGPRLREREWDKNYLFRVTMEGIPNSSMPGWKDRFTEQEIASVVAYVLTLSKASSNDLELGTASVPSTTAQSAESLKPASPSARTSTTFVAEKNGTLGDPQKGKLLFFDASNEINCGLCHRIRGTGNDIGPDLSAQKTRLPREILKDVLLPSASIASSRKPIRVTTQSGEIIFGILLEENSSQLKLFDMGALPAVLRTFPKSQIQSQSLECRSSMPEKYAEIYTVRQLLDIIAFLKDADPQSSPVSLKDLF